MAAFVQEIAQPHTFSLGVEDEETHTLVGYAGIGMMGPAADPEFEIHTRFCCGPAQPEGLKRSLVGLLTEAPPPP